MGDALQANALTLDDLRSELQVFASEVLQKELSNHLVLVQTGIFQDLRMLLQALPTGGGQLEGTNVEIQRSAGSKGSSANSSIEGNEIQVRDGVARLLDTTERKDAFVTPGLWVATTEVTPMKPVAGDCDVLDLIQNAQPSMQHEEWLSPAAPRSPRTPRTPKTPSHGSGSERGEPESTEAKRKSQPYLSMSSRAMDFVGEPSSQPGSVTRLRGRIVKLCGHVYFDYFAVVLIVLNSLLIGLQIDYMARHNLEETPMSLEVLEYAFCFLFTLELGVRLFAYHRFFFTMQSRWWNIFDFVIVTVQLIELALNILASGVGFNFNILRVLRLLRVARLARALRLIKELRTIVQSIAGSLKPLFWSAVLLFMVVYVFGICFTQIVHTKKISLMQDNKDIPVALESYWSTLMLSMLSLFESITGGVDWDDVCRPLIDHIGPEVGFLFCGYILFTVLALLNVVTGVFIDSVMMYASKAKEQATISNYNDLFEKLERENNGDLTWEAFEKHLNEKDMREFFKTIDIDITQARDLFELLDVDYSGSVNVGEFVDGCLRMWEPARGVDLRLFLRRFLSDSDAPKDISAMGKADSFTKLYSDHF